MRSAEETAAVVTGIEFVSFFEEAAKTETVPATRRTVENTTVKIFL
ncbi:MAG: hypothetical protein IJL26_00455 [Clostridia bacterium]|nr:hypothetical protein [Clostridia bacterium]